METLMAWIREWYVECSVLYRSIWGRGGTLVSCYISYRYGKVNADWPKNVSLFRKSQFLSNHYETWSKWCAHQLVIVTKLYIHCVLEVFDHLPMYDLKLPYIRAWQGRTLKLEKWGHLFLCRWHIVCQFSMISNKKELLGEVSNINCHFLLQ